MKHSTTLVLAASVLVLPACGGDSGGSSKMVTCESLIGSPVEGKPSCLNAAGAKAIVAERECDDGTTVYSVMVFDDSSGERYVIGRASDVWKDSAVDGTDGFWGC